MSLVAWSVIIMGGWTLAIIAGGLLMALRPGSLAGAAAPTD